MDNSAHKDRFFDVAEFVVKQKFRNFAKHWVLDPPDPAMF